MFKKLRIKFIAAAMTAVILVLAAIMTAINAVNYYKIRDYADGVLNILVENGGEFSEPSGQENDVGQGDIPPRKPDGKRDGGFYAETPYETRYFAVKYENGEKTANTERIFSVNEEEAVKIADEILKKGKKKGYYGVYRYAVSEKGDLVVLVDCFRQLETSNNFLYASIFISLGGIALVFLLVVVFSKKILRP
ncbi:MAG TPA: hypothetical protein DDW54_02400, partial [Clostridiales bacterium]|nr:hypothetical protein [Clostridiales bacterium]